MKMIVKGAAALSLALMLGSTAAAPVTYDFTFTDAAPDTLGRVDATGSFVTGNAATDPGFFLLTSLTFTSLFVDGASQTGSAVQTTFAAGSAYDPTTGAFVNHFIGNTYSDYGGGTARGTIGAFTSIGIIGSDFSEDAIQGSDFVGAARSETDESHFNYPAVLSIVAAPLADPGTVPEPGSIALMGLGLIGLAVSRRSMKR